MDLGRALGPSYSPGSESRRGVGEYRRGVDLGRALGALLPGSRRGVGEYRRGVDLGRALGPHLAQGVGGE